MNKSHFIPDLPWKESHGVSEGEPGATLLYGALADSYKVKSVLIIGSGGGFIPSFFCHNTAKDCSITLVDAMLPDSGSGSPYDYGNQLKNTCLALSAQFENFKFVKSLSADFLNLCSNNGIYFDLVFIDGDHSRSGFKNDLLKTLQVVSDEGIILFHDTNQIQIIEIANEYLEDWLNVSIGTGFGIYIHNSKLNTKKSVTNSPNISEKELIMLDDLNNAKKWDYLAAPSFGMRIINYWAYLDSMIDFSSIESYLEIGGNPTPIITSAMNQRPESIFCSIEPYVSPNSETLFKDAIQKGLEIKKSIFDVVSNFEIMFFLGIDLSLVSSYEELTLTISKIREKFNNSKYVIIEHPDFAPSKWLVELFSEDLELVEFKVWTFDNNLDISINGFTLTRKLYIFKPKPSMSQGISKTQQILLNRYSAYFDFENSPILDYTFAIPVRGDAYITSAVFNTWPVEKNTNLKIDFVWLRPKQKFRFPKSTKTLKFELYSNYASSLAPNLFWRFHIEGNLFIIKRRFLGRFWKRMTFPHFVPSESELGSTDNRKLSIAVKSFEYS